MKLVQIVIGLILLTACGSTTVDFDKSLRILRGAWTGQVSDITNGSTTKITLEFSPTYINEGEYSVSGIVRFGEDSPLEISGKVYAYGYKLIQGQSTPGFLHDVFLATIYHSDKSVYKELCLQSVPSQSNIEALPFVGDMGDSNTFDSNGVNYQCQTLRQTQRVMMTPAP